MAHFYGSIQGSRGEATRMGTKNSGFRAHIRGWNIGVQVYLRTYFDDNGVERDMVEVYKTSGSNGSNSDELIATFKEKN